MSEQLPTTATQNSNIDGHQTHQYGPNIDVPHDQLSGGHERDAASNSQPATSLTEESRGVIDEPPKKLVKLGNCTFTRGVPKSSCIRCKVKKVRCEPSGVEEGICKRCYSGRYECQYQIPDDKVRNTKWTRRIENLERTLSCMKANIPGAIASESSSFYNDSSPAADGSQTKEARIDRLEQTLLHYTSLENQMIESNTSNDGNVAPYAMNPAQHLSTSGFSGLSNEEIYSDVIDQGILDLRKAHALVQEFKTMIHNFPYVSITANLSTGTLRQDSPMLLLAICTAAAWKDRELQVRLERAYLEELARRMIVDGEQTLDMLQGLLVHLSWCHFHLKSAYRLTSLAISLVTTLGINHRPTPPGRQNLGVAFPFPNGARPLSTTAKAWSPAARRAYIGAYVICSSYAHALRKTSTLKYTPYLEECALSLSSSSGLPSDALLIHHVRLAHHVESISDTFDYDFSRSLSSPPDSQLSFHVRSFSVALSHIESLIPARLTTTSPLLTTSLLLASAYTHEIGLHGLQPHDALSLPRTTILIECLGSVRRVLDAITALDDSDLRALLGFNWARIHYALSLAVELSLGVTSPSWSVENVRTMLSLETYIDVFVQRLEGLSAMVRKNGDEGDWFGFLAAHWTELRRNYAEGMGNKGVVVPGGMPMEALGEAWLGLGDMDFMPSEWLWMAPLNGGL